MQVRDTVAQNDLRTLNPCRFGEGMGNIRRGEVSVHRCIQRAQKFFRIDKRENLFRFSRRQQFRINPQQFLLRLHDLEQFHAFRGRCQKDTASESKSRLLAGDFLNLLIEVNGVLLQLSDVRVAVDCVHAAGRVPCGPGRQLVAFQQHRVLPTKFGQVIQDGATDNAAANDYYLSV